MAVKMEVFSGDPPCPGCVAILALADEFAEKYKGKLEVIKLIGEDAMTKFEEYKLGCVPAVVINEKIRIEGICPSRSTLANALPPYDSTLCFAGCPTIHLSALKPPTSPISIPHSPLRPPPPRPGRRGKGVREGSSGLRGHPAPIDVIGFVL